MDQGRHVTHPGLHIKSAHDAHVLFEAVRLGHLPMIRRRLSGGERAQLRSGDVFVWEEAAHKGGLERWTDGRKWSASRMREPFLFYEEKVARKGPYDYGNNNNANNSASPLPSPSLPGVPSPSPFSSGSSSHSPSNSNSSFQHFSHSADVGSGGLTKQTYSAWVTFPPPDGAPSAPPPATTSEGGAGGGGTYRKKWHMTAYFSSANYAALPSVQEDPLLRQIRVPPNMYETGKGLMRKAPSKDSRPAPPPSGSGGAGAGYREEMGRQYMMPSGYGYPGPQGYHAVVAAQQAQAQPAYPNLAAHQGHGHGHLRYVEDDRDREDSMSIDDSEGYSAGRRSSESARQHAGHGYYYPPPQQYHHSQSQYPRYEQYDERGYPYPPQQQQQQHTHTRRASSPQGSASAGSRSPEDDIDESDSASAADDSTSYSQHSRSHHSSPRLSLTRQRTVTQQQPPTSAVRGFASSRYHSDRDSSTPRGDRSMMSLTLPPPPPQFDPGLHGQSTPPAPMMTPPISASSHTGNFPSHSPRAGGGGQEYYGGPGAYQQHVHAHYTGYPPQDPRTGGPAALSAYYPPTAAGSNLRGSPNRANPNPTSSGSGGDMQEYFPFVPPPSSSSNPSHSHSGSGSGSPTSGTSSSTKDGTSTYPSPPPERGAGERERVPSINGQLTPGGGAGGAAGGPWRSPEDQRALGAFRVAL